MTTEKLHFGEIRYNPERSAFETQVTFHEDGLICTYPVHVCAPLTAEYDHIMRTLGRKARILHRSNRFPMRLSRPVPELGATPPPAQAA